MKRNWSLEELIEYFTFMPNELRLLGNTTGETRLGFAVMLKFFQYEARFPSHKNEIPKEIILYISKQLQLDSSLFNNYNWSGRTIKYHRAQIREFFNFRECTLEDMNRISGSTSTFVKSLNFSKYYCKT